MNTTARLDLYQSLQTARGDKRRVIALKILSNELECLIEQVKDSAVSVESAAQALRTLAEMLDEASTDPTRAAAGA